MVFMIYRAMALKFSIVVSHSYCHRDLSSGSPQTGFAWHKYVSSIYACIQQILYKLCIAFSDKYRCSHVLLILWMNNIASLALYSVQNALIMHAFHNWQWSKSLEAVLRCQSCLCDWSIETCHCRGWESVSDSISTIEALHNIEDLYLMHHYNYAAIWHVVQCFIIP